MKFADFEVRVCSILFIMIIIVCCISLFMFIQPEVLRMLTEVQWGECTVEDYKESFKCGSCSRACTASEALCILITVRFKDKIVPLRGNQQGCGYHLDCNAFYENYSAVGATFDCLLLDSRIAVPTSGNTRSDSVHRLCISLLPFLFLLACLGYTLSRRLLTKGTPKTRPLPPPPPKSFYEMKVLQMDQMKRDREERERQFLYEDDVKVEDLTTVTSLVYKPSWYWKTKLQESSLIPPSP